MTATRLTHLTIDELCRILTAAGSQTISPEHVRNDIAAGAPCNDDGTINLITYSAWTLKALSDKERSRGR